MAISDISFVCSKDKCPNGYEILLKCPCGSPANLWKKFVGAPAEERYLCFSRESKDGKIIEDMYIPGSNERYVMKGFEVVKRTIEGEDSLNCKYLAIKRTPRSSAKSGVSDIAVYKCKDKPPSCYKKLGAKLNGLYICAKIEPIEDIAKAPPTSQEDAHSTPTVSSPPASNQGHAKYRYDQPPPPNNASSYRHQDKSPAPNYSSQHVPDWNSSASPPPAPANSNVYSYQGGPVPQTPPPPPQASYASQGPPLQTTYAPPPTVPPADHSGFSYSSALAVGVSATKPSEHQSELLLGFEHLDLDQPIEFEQNGVFEDSPPDSPVEEHATIDVSYNLSSAAPHPPSSSHYPNQPQYGYPPQPPVPQYPQTQLPGSGQYYRSQLPPGPGQYYGTQLPPRPGQYYGAQVPSGPGQYYQSQAPPRPVQYPQSQGYPPPYNPNQQQPSNRSTGSSNIGFNI